MDKNNLRFLSVLILAIPTYALAYLNPESTSATNHPFERVEIAYRNDDCSFQYSPTDFCSERYLDQIKNAIANTSANFDRRFILISIPIEKGDKKHNSLAAIDTKSGVVYPFPFDEYSGYVNDDGSYKGPGKLSFSLNSPTVCIEGSVLAGRATDLGKMCYTFDTDRFVGHRTAYTDCGPDETVRCTSPWD